MPIITSDRNPEIEYLSLVDRIDARQISAAEMMYIHEGRIDVTERLLWIRHDIDHRVEDAVEMARAENTHGIAATYFFLHTAPYWQNGMDEAVARIRALGHGIGLHNNAMVVGRQKGLQPHEVFTSAIKRLEGITGLPVFATSAHGDRYCHEHGFLNYDFLSPDTLRALGVFEAYFVRRDAYLTDSGAKWRGQIRDKIPPFEQFEDWLSPAETVDKFNAMESGVMQLLVHPCWWSVK